MELYFAPVNVDLFAENKKKMKSEGANPATPVEMSVHAVQSDPITYDVKFSETSSLSYMERLLLKKHRYTSSKQNISIIN